MLINFDICCVVADIEILGHIKRDEWPGYEYIFDKPIITVKEGRVRHKSIVHDPRFDCPKFALWAAINCPYIDIHDHLNYLNVSVLYKNGFITKFDKFASMIYSAINTDEIAADTLATITAHDSTLYANIYRLALSIKSLGAIKWLYATIPKRIYATHAKMIERNAHADIMEYYASVYPDWLSGANETIMHKINTCPLHYNDALSWLIKKVGFDMRSLIAANDGELLQDIFNRIENGYGFSSMYNVFEDFHDIIGSLSRARLQSISSVVYEKNDVFNYEEFIYLVKHYGLNNYTQLQETVS